MTMRTSRLIVVMVVALMCATATARTGTITDGENAWLSNGSPAKLGQPTADHLFVRELGPNGVVINDCVAFDQGDTKLVWLWLDDDAIYTNDKVQALTPIPYNSAGDLYHEITYNSFQCDLYLPTNVLLVSIENEDGDMIDFQQGGRLPSSASVFYGGGNTTKTIDGVRYNVYTVMCSNTAAFGSHFSAKHGALYRQNGALKKDDAPLVGLFLKMDGASTVTGEIGKMIIANVEFGFREAFTVEPNWEPNEYRFFYGTGGNNTVQRYQYYHRATLMGGGELPTTPKPLISTVVTNDAVTIIASGEGQVTLQVDGVTVENPYSIARGNEDFTVAATATALADGMLMSETASLTVLIPAKPEELPSGNQLAVPPTMIVENDTDFALPVSMDNEDEITALQCDVFLPDGFTLAQDSVGKYLIDVVGERVTGSHTVSARQLDNGVVRVLITSPEAQPFAGHKGELFGLRVKVAHEVVEGSYEVTIGNIILADVKSTTYNAAAVTSQIFVKTYQQGDANGDGMINVGDYVTAANYILELNPDPFIFSAADVDQNKAIDVGDLVGITNLAMDQ